MAITNSNIEFCSTPVTTDYYTSWAGQVSDVRTLLSVQGENLMSRFSQAETQTIFNNGLLKIEMTCTLYNNQPKLSTIQFTNLNTSKNFTINNPNFGRSLYLCLGYDDDNRTAYHFAVGQFYYNGDWTQQEYGAFTNNQEDMYLAISGSQVQPVQITEAGAGSGYIGNSLLSNKKMVGYNVPTSSDAGTETESTNEYHSEGVAGKAKVGNGKVKITFLG